MLTFGLKQSYLFTFPVPSLLYNQTLKYFPLLPVTLENKLSLPVTWLLSRTEGKKKNHMKT